ncbi:MAG: SulP family inorganic anion transporter [Alphaproteobacteria bacterium]|nr:SulP family inorganic anion transporter [Alphaproteobacteria bacterium]
MAIGVIAFTPLGSDYISVGIIAALMGSVILTVFTTLFGGAPGLLAGPRASTSLLFAAICAGILAAEPLFESGADKPAIALSLAMIATMAAGLLLMLFGLFRLGDTIKLVPFPVVAGFLNAAAILIIVSQIRVVFGLPEEASIFETWRFVDLDSLARVGVVIVTGVSIFAIPKILPQVPGLISGALVGIGVYYAVLATGTPVDLGPTIPAIPSVALDPQPLEDLFGVLATRWGVIIGDSASGSFAGLRIDSTTLPILLSVLVPGAISLALLQALDGLFSGLAYEDLTQQRLDARRELAAVGAGTIVCGCTTVLVGTSSLGRTLPSYNAGGRTAWAGVASSVFTLATILFLAPFVAYIPNLIVAGLLIVLGAGIFDKWTISLLKNLKTNRLATRRVVVTDLAIIALVVGTAIVFGLVEAVGVGVTVAIAEFVLGIGRSPVRRIYRGDAVSAFLQRGNFSAALLREHGSAIGVIEIEGPFFFGSAGRVETETDRLAEAGARHVILDFKRVSTVDSTASRTLLRLAKRLGAQGKTLSISYVMPEQPADDEASEDGQTLLNPYAPHENWMKLNEFGTLDALGRAHFFPDTDTALRQCEMLLVADITERGDEPLPAWPNMTGLFDELSDEEMKIVRSFSEECRYDAGSTIFEQGEPGDALYILLDGMVDALVKQQPTGRDIRVNTMTSGAVFGEMAILDPQPRSATIVAMEASTCFRIRADQLENLTVQHPALGLRIVKFMCLLFSTRLRMANIAIMELES